MKSWSLRENGQVTEVDLLEKVREMLVDTRDMIGTPELDDVWRCWQEANPYDFVALEKGYHLLNDKLIEAIRNNDPSRLQSYYDEILEKIAETLETSESQAGSGQSWQEHPEAARRSFKASAEVIKAIGDQLRRVKSVDKNALMLRVGNACKGLIQDGSPENVKNLREVAAAGILLAVNEHATEELDEIADEVGEVAEVLAEKGLGDVSCQLDGIYCLLEFLLADLDLEAAVSAVNYETPASRQPHGSTVRS